MTEYESETSSVKPLRLARLLSILCKLMARDEWPKAERLADYIATEYQVQLCLYIRPEGPGVEVRSALPLT